MPLTNAADTSETRVVFIEETTFGTTPANPAFQTLRITGESLVSDIQNVVSDELRSDAMVADLIQVGESASGDLNFELSKSSVAGAGDTDTLLEQALRGDFAKATTGAHTGDVGSTSTFTRATGSYLDDGFVAGMSITTTNYTNAANNGTFVIQSVVDLTITITTTPLFVESGTGDENITETTLLSVLKGGTAKKSMTVEKTFETGATDQYFRFTGCRVGTFGFSMRARQPITATIGVQGLGHTIGTAILSGATYVAANTNDFMSPVDAANITIGGTSGTIFLTDLSFSLTNNLRDQATIGQIAAAGIGYGRREITGSLVAYFESADLYEEFVNGTAAALSWETIQGANKYRWRLPRIKYISGRVVAGGNNQDVLADMRFQAVRDADAATDILVMNS